MKSNGIFEDFSKKISWLSGKSFLSNVRTLIDETPILLDKGLARTVKKKMNEVMELCRKKGKKKDKDYFWVYSMIGCFYLQSFSRFGVKFDEDEVLDELIKIADENDFFDAKFWILKFKMENYILSGRVKKFEAEKSKLLEYADKFKNAGEYKGMILPFFVTSSIEKRDFEEAKNYLKELNEVLLKDENINLKIFSKTLEGIIYFELEKIPEAITSLKEAISLDKGELYEKRIVAIYTLTEVLIRKGEIEEAKSYLKEAQIVVEKDAELENTIYAVNLQRVEGLIFVFENNFEEAEKIFKKALIVAENNENLKEIGKLNVELGELFIKIKEFDKAIGCLEEASGQYVMLANQYQINNIRKMRESIKGSIPKKKNEDVSADIESQPAQKVKALDSFMKMTIGNLDLDVVLNNVLDHIMNSTKADRGFVVLIDENDELYSQVARMKKDVDKKVGGDGLKQFSRSITDRVIKNKKSILVNDIKDDHQLASSQSIAGLDIRSAVCVPLKNQDDGSVIGLIYLDRQSFVGAFADEDLQLVESLSEYASIAVNNAKMHFGIKKKLETTQEQLIHSEKMATIGILAGGVAHEINTPLGTILNNTELLMMDELTEEQKEGLEMIKQGTLRCKTIVEQLLKYSRKTSMEFEDVDTNAVINDACIILEHQLSVQGITIRREYGDIQIMKGNPTELSQVVTNLLVNARDAIIERKITQENQGLIIIKTLQTDNVITIEISDNGCGIPEELMSKIYDPFYTSKEVGQGTGLGLSIVQKIIERHGGRIEIHSENGKGTVISIKFLI